MSSNLDLMRSIPRPGPRSELPRRPPNIHGPIPVEAIGEDSETSQLQPSREAQLRTRSGDPFLTMEVLYQLS